MRAFLITWVALCFLVVVSLFITYATDQLPGTPAPKQIELGGDEDCSPCEENLKQLKKAIERAESERQAAAGAASDIQ